MGLTVEEFYEVWAESVSLTDRMKEAFLTTARTGEGVRNIMSMLGAYRKGQVHRLYEKRGDHREIRTMVKLLAWVDEGLDRFGGPTGCWLVEDLRTGHKEQVGENYLSLDHYNEMEVLAWASQ
jgi:hypothetical protein